MTAERVIKITSIAAIVTIIGFSLYFGFNIFFWQDVYEEIPVTKKVIRLINAETGEMKEIVYNKTLEKGDSFAVLLLGTDSDSIKQGRTDTIIIAVVQPKTNTITLVSVPRDTYLINQATGKYDKATHAFNYGVSNTVRTIEEYFQIPITYFALINMDGFIDMIDAIGGIYLNPQKEMTFYDRITNRTFTIKPGYQLMNGIQAINYARFRGDAEGDFGRNRRQREVITALIKQTADFRNISKINKILGVISKNFRTNIKTSEIPFLLNQLQFDDSLTVNEIQLKGTPARRQGMSVVIVDEQERLRIASQLQQMLNLNGH